MILNRIPTKISFQGEEGEDIIADVLFISNKLIPVANVGSGDYFVALCSDKEGKIYEIPLVECKLINFKYGINTSTAQDPNRKDRRKRDRQVIGNSTYTKQEDSSIEGED